MRRAEAREIPDYLVPMGRTAGFPANGAVSNLAPFPAGGVVAPRRELRQGRYDVVHIHEPVVPLVGWNAALGTARRPSAPSTPTRPRRSPTTSPSALGARRVFNRLSARIAVSEAAAWTGRRWFGGHYEIVPNGVDVDAAPQRPEAARRGAAGRSSSAAPRSARACRSCSTAFEALVEHVPCRLTVIGAEREDVLRYLADPETMRWIDVRGRVSGESLWRRCTTPTCSAPRRSRARASAWS